MRRPVSPQRAGLLLCGVLLLAGCGRCGQRPGGAPDAGSPPAAQAPDATGFRTPLTPEELARLPWALAFLREDTGLPQVALLDLADGGEVALTQGPLAHYVGPVSPRGDALVVIATEDHGDQHLEALSLWRPDGGTTVLSRPSPRARGAAFAPGGEWLVLESGEKGFSELVRVSMNGRARAQLTNHPEGNFEPSISPDGGEVAFTSSRDQEPNLFVMDAQGKATRRLVSSAGEDVAPQWSPRGDWICFTSARAGEDQLFLIHPDGTGERRLHFEPTPRSRAMPEAVEQQAVWSPDGTKVAYSGRPAGGKLRIWVVDVASGARTPVTDGTSSDEHPAWSPDGRYLAFSSTRDGNPELYVMRADGSGQTRVTRSTRGSWLPRWAPRALLPR